MFAISVDATNLAAYTCALIAIMNVYNNPALVKVLFVSLLFNLSFLVFFFIYSPRCFPPWCSDTLPPSDCVVNGPVWDTPFVLSTSICLPSHRCIPPSSLCIRVHSLPIHTMIYTCTSSHIFFIHSCLTQLLLVFINCITCIWLHTHTQYRPHRGTRHLLRNSGHNSTTHFLPSPFFSPPDSLSRGRSHGRVYT